VTRDRAHFRHVVIVGLMGAGKTTVGSPLADRLGWPLIDSDVVLERKLGQTVREWRERMGTKSLHALEAQQLRDALAAPARSVIAPAASTIDDAGCRAALMAPDILVVWLRADAATLAARFAEQGHRPAYGPDPARFLADQEAARDPDFAAVADLVVDTDDRPVAEVVAEISRRLAEPHSG
jgi:shikimate kinase